MNLERESILIRGGGVGVIPTDTIYGLVCSAFSPESVERVYRLKMRDAKKPFIVLISEERDVEKFGIALNDSMRKVFNKYWPGPVSIILPCDDDSFSYIHRGLNSISFRLPDDDSLCDFLCVSGPLVAPSANPEGEIPARNIEEAKAYFGDKVDFYIDGGELEGSPSRILSLVGGKEEWIR